MWLGRAFQPKSYDLGYESPGRIIVAARVIRTSYEAKPFPFYQNASLMLGTVGYSVRRYYKDKYLFGFGRTEDIPTGSLVSFTTGYEFNEAGNRRYYGLRVSTATLPPPARLPVPERGVWRFLRARARQRLAAGPAQRRGAVLHPALPHRQPAVAAFPVAAQQPGPTPPSRRVPDH